MTAQKRNGANLELGDRTEKSNQKFHVEYVGDGFYKITNLNSSLPLDVVDGKNENGTNIRQWEDNESDAQKWKIRKNIDGSYNIIPKVGNALDITEANISNGTNIQTYEYNNSYAQKFAFESTTADTPYSCNKKSNNKY